MKKFGEWLIPFIYVIVMIVFTGCGVSQEDRIKIKAEAAVREHFRQNDDLMKVFDIDKCTVFVIEPIIEDGHEQLLRNRPELHNKVVQNYKVFVDLLLKGRKTGKLCKMTYELTYRAGNNQAIVQDVRWRGEFSPNSHD